MGADRIPLDITQGGPEVGWSEAAGKEPVLPEVAAPGKFRIGVGGVAAVSLTESACQRGGLARRDDPMDVVGHEAISEQVRGVAFGGAEDEREVDGVVGGGGEDLTAVEAALGEMVGDAG